MAGAGLTDRIRGLGNLVVERTVEGASALSTIVSRAAGLPTDVDTIRSGEPTVEPELVAFAGATAINEIGALTGLEKVRKSAKVTLMPLLAGNVVRHRSAVGEPGSGVFLAGLAGGWLGDIVLMRAKPNLNHGAIPFSANQIAYHVLLWRAGARPQLATALPRAIAWAGACAAVLKIKPAFAPAAFGYGALLTATSILASDRNLVRGLPVGDARYGLSHGGNLFLLSDVLLSLRETLPTGGAASREGFVGRVLDAAVMETYCDAQLLLVSGLMETEARSK